MGGWCWGWCCGGGDALVYIGTAGINVSGQLVVHEVASDLSSITSSVQGISGQSVAVKCIAADSDGNLYLNHYNRLIKYNSSLTQQWDVPASLFDPKVVAVDVDNGYVYTAGATTLDSSDPQIRKYDLDGNEVTTGSWPVSFGPGAATGGKGATVWSLAIDSIGRIWAGHNSTNATIGDSYPTLTVLDVDGTKLSQYQPFGQVSINNYQVPFSIKFDSSGDIWFALGPTYNPTTMTSYNVIEKRKSSDRSLYWGAQPDSTSQSGYDVHLFDGESKAAVSMGTAGSNDTLKVYNSSTGSELWGDNYPAVKRLGGDSSGNLYTVTQDTTTSVGTPKTVLVKYDSSGSTLEELDYGDYGEGLLVI